MAKISEIIGQTTPKGRFELTEGQLRALKTGSKIALVVIGMAGFVLLTAAAPNIFMAMDKIFGKKRGIRTTEDRESLEQKVERTIYYLKRVGYVKLIPQGGDYRIELTKKGLRLLRKFQFDSLRIDPCGRPWDGRWWIVVADVPSDKFRHAADKFHQKLKSMSFYPLQRTVWMYPFDPRREIDYVSTYYRINGFVTVMEVARVDPSDKKVLVKHFREAGIL